MEQAVTLKTMPWHLSVCKLLVTGLPDWSKHSRFLSYNVTGEEISLVCESECVPDDVTAETEFKCIRVEGILDFSLIGIIAKITNILAQKKISVFVISTFDTDYILVRGTVLLQATNALKDAGYSFA
jgi:uncharacterized protein